MNTERDIMILNEKQTKGIRAEALAKEYFVENDYLVFSAEGGIGPIDLITIKDGETRYFDVKTNAKRADGTKICRTNNKVPGIKVEIVYVDLDTKEVKEHKFDKGEWHKRYKIGRNEKGHYNGKVIERE